MNVSNGVRILLALAVLVLGLGALLLLLVISESTLTVQARLADAPSWMTYAWWGLLGMVGLLIGFVIWRILMPERRRRMTGIQPEVPSREALDASLEKAREAGVDVSAIEAELAELARRREAGEIHVATFGEISTGKSALIRALLPDAELTDREIVSDVRGGTTDHIECYQWHSPGGDTLLLTDMPGTSQVGGQLDDVAREEAARSHVVIFVTDGDVNRTQHESLQALIELGKPLILVLNKTDRFSPEELDLLGRRLQGLLQGVPNSSFVKVSAATTREVMVQEADGSERMELRPVPPAVQPLARALQRIVDGNQALLDRLSDSATFVLAGQQLDHAMAETRRVKAEQLVESYARKAVIGALAAITPGSDILIQGYLGTQLVRELAALYDTPVRKVDTDLLLKLVKEHAARAHTLLLAVAGNALKAFPGVGTLAGGAMHAVAYGIIFRTLGRALTTALATRGELQPRQAAKLFEEKLSEDLDTSARGLAKLVVQQLTTDDRQRSQRQ